MRNESDFIAGRSTIDHLFTVTHLIDEKAACSQEIHWFDVDLREAYESIPFNILCNNILQTNINIDSINAVESLYSKNRFKIKGRERLIEGLV